MQYLGTTCQIFIGYLTEHIGDGQRPVLYFGFGCTADILT